MNMAVSISMACGKMVSRLGVTLLAASLFAGVSTAASADVQALPTHQTGLETARFAYVGSRTTKERKARGEGINVYRVDPKTGEFTHVQLIKDLVNPSFLAFDRTQTYLYSVHGDFSEVSAFKVDKTTGKLTFINRQSTQGKNPVHLVADKSNKFLYVANYATGSLASFPINPDGSLAPLTSLEQVTGTPGPHKTQQKGAHPHHIPYDATEKFLVVPDKGLDKVFVYRPDAQTGKLDLVSSIASREGAAPRHVSFHPTRPLAYVSNELDSTVATYKWDSNEGKLTPLQILTTQPETYTGNNTASEIEIDPSGKFVYVSNRGHDSIAAFKVDTKTGLLASAGWTSSQGKGPRFFSIAPGGDYLYAANENSDTIVTFKINKKTGALSYTGQTIKTGSPVCVIFSTSKK